MLYPRIIPCLLIRNNGLVKTVNFKMAKSKYIGDPLNAVRIFNEKKVDELMVIDIDATTENREPNYKLIENIAAECRMPLCYGGGVKTVTQIEKIIQLGVEKVAISSIAIEEPEMVSKMAAHVGNQSVVVVLDVKKRTIGKKYDIWKNNARINTKQSPLEFAKKLEELGVGEIVINSIDNDGIMRGYDIALIKKIHASISVPVTALGGAGSLKDISELINNCGLIGAAAGSLFVFKGVYRAVLINYPDRITKESLYY